MAKLLLIGGTGIVGKATVREALQRGGYDIVTVSLGREDSYPETVTQIIADRKDRDGFAKALSDISNEHWDVVFDIFSFDGKDAAQTYELFGKSAGHVFVISTTLVYDRSKPNEGLITEQQPLAQKGELGGYVDHKLELELFWAKATDANWTILRPYHIIGAGSLIGCLPLHNRDPHIVECIEKNEVLELCNDGDVDLSFINPRDIAQAALESAGNKTTYHEAYNLVYPEIVTARHYYELLGELLGRKVSIKSKPIEEIWDEELGWELTTLPHRYSIEKLQKDISFTPAVSLKQSLQEALVSYPPTDDNVLEIPIHRRMNLLPRPKSIQWI